MNFDAKLEKFLPTTSTVECLHVDHLLPAAVFMFVLLFALLFLVLLLWLSLVSLVLVPAPSASVRAGRGRIVAEVT